MTPELKSLSIADYEVLPVATGVFGLDGGSMFGTVPKVLWEKVFPADSKNRIPMEARALLLKGKNRNILIDCGNGHFFKEKYGEKLGSHFSEMYNVKEDGPSLLKSLKQYSLEPNDITDVILTHLHFDHCGGATTWSEGKIIPQFSKATYYIQKQNLETAQNPNIREKASYLSANFLPLLEANVLKVLKNTEDFHLPGISMEISNGHTLGQQIIKISDSKNTLVYCGDLIPTRAHIRLAWVMGYDLDPLLIIKEKATLLNQAADQGWYLYFEHDFDIDACKIDRNGSDFKVGQTFKLIEAKN